MNNPKIASVKQMKKWTLYWSPEGKAIGVVLAHSASAAIRKAPKPYKKYLGEIYAEERA